MLLKKSCLKNSFKTHAVSKTRQKGFKITKVYWENYQYITCLCFEETLILFLYIRFYDKLNKHLTDFRKDILVFLKWFRNFCFHISHNNFHFLRSHKNLSCINILDRKTARLQACGQENHNSSSWKEKVPSMDTLPCNLFLWKEIFEN